MEDKGGVDATSVAELRRQARECLNTNRAKEALYLYDRICRLAPGDADAWFTLAKMYGQLGRLDLAEHAARKALSAQAGFGAAHLLLGMSLVGQGRFEGAISHFETAAGLMPDNAKVFNNFGNALVAMGDAAGAIEKYQRAIEIDPTFAEAYNNLGAAFLGEARYGEAIRCFDQAIEHKAAFPAAYNNLAIANERRGNVYQAIESYKKALAIHEGYGQAHSNLLVAMNYADYYPPSRVYEEHVRWAQLHGGAPRGTRAISVDKAPDRLLRIGYVSGDFRSHSVSYFFEPLLSSHDSGKTHVICYSDVAKEDETTRRIRELADDWRHICGLPAAEVGDMIQADHIDILVDLVGHTSTNRMEVFASKPAAIQITYIGYPNTTGLSTMDYRIIDDWTDPPGMTEQYHTERLLRLQGGFLCFRPGNDVPEVADSPYKANGYITFGSFNKLAKVTPEVVGLWSRVLTEVPDSRLFLKDASFVDRGVKERYLSLFEARGIEGGRLELIEARLSHSEHLDLYRNVDIGLDTFPYNGTTTTCEALWMGVPVVTLAGRVHAGRVGVSLMSQIERRMWIAENPTGYIEIAKDLASAIAAGRFDRRGLRDHISASSLCDERSYGERIQQLYRELWQRYCVEAAGQ